jgi:large subunit ribosomal protein L31
MFVLLGCQICEIIRRIRILERLNCGILDEENIKFYFLKFFLEKKKIQFLLFVYLPSNFLRHRVMRKDIHPENYRLVVFKDMSNETAFITKSAAASKETIKWEDGNEYPLIKLEISNTSHPF